MLLNCTYTYFPIIISYQSRIADSLTRPPRLSVVSVLQTALPSTLIQEALTNPAGVSSELASEFAADETPAWFTALPTDVQTYLIPAIANATATAVTSATGTGGLIPGSNNNISTTNGTSFTSSTLITSSSSSSTSTSTQRHTTTVTESSQTGASATGFRGSSSSEAGAAMPTVVAMGLAGLAAGMFGVLAL